MPTRVNLLRMANDHMILQKKNYEIISRYETMNKRVQKWSLKYYKCSQINKNKPDYAGNNFKFNRCLTYHFSI